jgi:hypothetical protein
VSNNVGCVGRVPCALLLAPRVAGDVHVMEEEILRFYRIAADGKAAAGEAAAGEAAAGEAAAGAGGVAGAAGEAEAAA